MRWVLPIFVMAINALDLTSKVFLSFSTAGMRSNMIPRTAAMFMAVGKTSLEL